MDDVISVLLLGFSFKDPYRGFEGKNNINVIILEKMYMYNNPYPNYQLFLYLFTELIIFSFMIGHVKFGQNNARMIYKCSKEDIVHFNTHKCDKVVNGQFA